MVYSAGLSVQSGGGIATKMFNIILESSCDNIEYTIITNVKFQDISSVKRLQELGVKIVDLSLCKRSITHSLKVFKKLASCKFDVVHFQEMPFAWNFEFGFLTSFLLLKSKINKTEFLYEHQIASGNLHRLHIALQYVLFKFFFHFWNKVIVNSKIMHNEALKIVNKPDKILYIPLGVPFKEIHHSSNRLLDGFPLFFFGHLTRIKGIDLVIEAFEIINQRSTRDDVHLYIAGDGYLRGYCEDFVKNKNLAEKVHFLGAQPQDILFTFLKSAYICVLPSRNDSGPLTVLESMAAGKPVVTTNVGLVPELFVNGRNGLIVDCNSENIARAVLLLINNPELRIQMGENNLKDIAEYSWKRATEKYVSLYKSLM